MAPARPEDASGVQTGRDSAAGKDFNKDLRAGLDSLNNALKTHTHIIFVNVNDVLRLAPGSCSRHH